MKLLYLGAALFAVAAFSFGYPFRDPILRYAPMAEAFAAGRWADAFHPRFGVLFPSVSGIFALTGISGFHACQLAGLFFFLAGLWPFREILKECHCTGNEVHAGTIVYLFCSRLHRMFYEGFRETSTCFAILLAVWGLLLFCRKGGYRGFAKPVLAVAFGCAMLTCSRAEGTLPAAVALATFLIRDICLFRGKSIRGPAAILLYLLLVAPQVYLVYSWTGYPVPNSGHVRILETVLPSRRN